MSVAARATNQQLTVCASLLLQCYYCRSLYSHMINLIHIQRKCSICDMFPRVLLPYEVGNQREALNQVPANRGVADKNGHGKYCYGMRPSRFTSLLHLIQVILWVKHRNQAHHGLPALSLHHDFLTLLVFQNQGERTSWVSGAVHKRADSVSGVIEQVFRAVFRAYDRQVLIFQVPFFPSDRPPKAPLSPQHARPITFYATPPRFCNFGRFHKI